MRFPVAAAGDPEGGNPVKRSALLPHDNDDQPERDLRSPAGLWTSVLGKLGRKQDLAPEEATTAMSAILEGHATPVQIAGFALALRMKGETTAEIAALVRTLLHYAQRLEVEGLLVDTAGTGGDGAGTVNVSTMAALIVAGAEVRVAKQEGGIFPVRVSRRAGGTWCGHRPGPERRCPLYRRRKHRFLLRAAVPPCFPTCRPGPPGARGPHHFQLSRTTSPPGSGFESSPWSVGPGDGREACGRLG